MTCRAGAELPNYLREASCNLRQHEARIYDHLAYIGAPQDDHERCISYERKCAAESTPLICLLLLHFARRQLLSFHKWLDLVNPGRIKAREIAYVSKTRIRQRVLLFYETLSRS
jgi:hypothetical protein